ATPRPIRRSRRSRAASGIGMRGSAASPPAPRGSTTCAAASPAMRTAMPEIELLHPELEVLVDSYLKRRGWSWQSLERGEREIAGQPLTVDSLQWWLINADPLLWIETNLVNKPEDGGGLWRMFDYQRTSLRFRGHTVHQDGAEVGKSREIV